MSNNTVDPATGHPLEEEEDPRDLTHITFRLKTDQVQFYKRMAFWFFQNNLIDAPKLSLLAKAALNIAGHRFEKFEEITMARFVQKELAKARGPQAPYVRLGQYQGEQPVKMGQTLREEASPVVPLELKKTPPLDKIKEPEWYGGWE